MEHTKGVDSFGDSSCVVRRISAERHLETNTRLHAPHRRALKVGLMNGSSSHQNDVCRLRSIRALTHVPYLAKATVCRPKGGAVLSAKSFRSAV